MSYLKFRAEFPYVVKKKANWQYATANCNENPLDGYYDVTPSIYSFTTTYGAKKKMQKQSGSIRLMGVNRVFVSFKDITAGIRLLEDTVFVSSKLGKPNFLKYLHLFGKN